MSRLASKIEAILYLKGQPLAIAQIAEYACCDRSSAAEALVELTADYRQRDCALEIVETSDGFCLQLREAFQDLVQTLIPVDLGGGSLENISGDRTQRTDYPNRFSRVAWLWHLPTCARTRESGFCSQAATV
jgi:Segregation and condensation complex subunit ScpB